MSTFIGIAIILVGCLIGFEVLRWSITKAAINKVFCIMLTAAGTAKTGMFPYRGEEVKANWDSGPVQTYFLREHAAYSMAYPLNMPGFLQTTVKCAIFNENEPEPIAKKRGNSEMIATASLIGAMRDEHFTEEMVMAEERVKDTIKRMEKVAQPRMLLLIVVIGALMAGAAGYMAWQGWQGQVELQQGIEAIKQAQGI